jgi:hypothetical protein
LNTPLFKIEHSPGADTFLKKEVERHAPGSKIILQLNRRMAGCHG